jgi:hypothetical protein
MVDFFNQPFSNLNRKTMKNILFGIFILSVTLSCVIENGKSSGENGTLSGVLTYKDSHELSNHADVGGEIYAINEADVKSTQYGDITRVIENFQRNKSDYSLARYNTLDLAKIIELQDNFDSESNFARNYISGFKKLPTIVKASTNGTGNYTLSLRAGKYYILVISGNVKSNNIAETKGNIDYKIVDIKPAGETFLDVNFEKSENILIMLITGWQRQGC